MPPFGTEKAAGCSCRSLAVGACALLEQAVLKFDSWQILFRRCSLGLLVRPERFWEPFLPAARAMVHAELAVGGVPELLSRVLGHEVLVAELDPPLLVEDAQRHPDVRRTDLERAGAPALFGRVFPAIAREPRGPHTGSKLGFFEALVVPLALFHCAVGGALCKEVVARPDLGCGSV